MRGRLRVLSANLANGRAHPTAFARLVERLEPDVVAVQELSPEQADALARVMPGGTLAPSRDFGGMGIALGGPGVVRRLPLPCRDALVVELQPDGVGFDAGSVEVVNVHLIAPHAEPLWHVLALRRGQLAGLERYLAEGSRRQVVIGDLNATPLWPAYRRLAARLEDAAVVAARRRERRPRSTWGPWSRGPRLLRIDHALVRGLAVLDVRVEPVRGSDHSALLVDVAADAEGEPTARG